jgi:hypothetical protein
MSEAGKTEAPKDKLLEFECRHQVAAGWQHSQVKSTYYKATSAEVVKRHVLSSQIFEILSAIYDVKKEIEKKCPIQNLKEPFCRMKPSDLAKLLDSLPDDNDTDELENYRLDLSGFDDKAINDLWDEHRHKFDGAETEILSIHQYATPQFHILS